MAGGNNAQGLCCQFGFTPLPALERHMVQQNSDYPPRVGGVAALRAANGGLGGLRFRPVYARLRVRQTGFEPADRWSVSRPLTGQPDPKSGAFASFATAAYGRGSPS